MSDKIKLFDMENNGMNIAIDGQFLFILCNLTIYKYDLTTMSLSEQHVIFKKDGKARGISIFGDNIFIHDFLDLHILEKDSLKVKEVLRLGENVSSDVCGVMWVDSTKVYVKIRNGWIYVLDINTNALDKGTSLNTRYCSLDKGVSNAQHGHTVNYSALKCRACVRY